MKAYSFSKVSDEIESCAARKLALASALNALEPALGTSVSNKPYAPGYTPPDEEEANEFQSIFSDMLAQYNETSTRLSAMMNEHLSTVREQFISLNDRCDSLLYGNKALVPVSEPTIEPVPEPEGSVAWDGMIPFEVVLTDEDLADPSENAAVPGQTPVATLKAG